MMKSVMFWVALALASSAGTAWADDAPGPFYVEADIGHASLNRGAPTATGASSGIAGNDTSVMLAGGYVINDYLAAELAYHDYGKPGSFIQSSTITGQACPQDFSCPHVNGLSAELIGRYELVPQLDGELRAGVLDWHVGSPGSALLSNTSGNAFIYGLGVRRHFDYGLSLVITYERSSFTTEETRIGLSYSF